MIRNTESKIAPGIDTRGDGGYFAAAPSIRTDGSYTWEIDEGPFDRVAATWPKELTAAIPTESSKAKTCADDAVVIPEGKRNGALASLAGSMRNRGMGEGAIAAALLKENEAKCKPPLPESEVHAIAHSVSRYDPKAPVTEPPLVRDGDEPECETQGKGKICLRLIAAGDVSVRRTEWIEPHRIPLSKFVLLEGAGDLGKTTLAMGLIAAATRGEHFFPVEESDARLYPPKPRRVLIVAREDDLGILKARLVVAKAVLDRAIFVDGRDLVDMEGNVEEAGTSFMLPRDIEPLRRAIEETATEIVYVDALHSHVVIEGDVKSPQAVRQTYHQIVELLNATDVTLLSTRHWGKGVGRATDRGLGSSEIGHVARAILTFAKHPEIEGRYLVAQTKKNLAKGMPAIEYRLEILDATDDAGNEWTVTKAVVEGVAEGVTADDLAMALPVDRETRTLKEEATQAILAAFGDDETITAEALDKARTDAGCAARTWERARADLTRSHVLNRSREGTDGPVIYAINRSRIKLFAKESLSSPHLGDGEQRPGVANNGTAPNFATAPRRSAQADGDCLSAVLANPAATMTAADITRADQEPVSVAMADDDPPSLEAQAPRLSAYAIKRGGLSDHGKLCSGCKRIDLGYRQNDGTYLCRTCLEETA
jgi:hypothetical protein